MILNSLRFTALIKMKNEEGREMLFLAPYTDYPEKLFCYIESLSAVKEFEPIVVNIPNKMLGKEISVSVGIKKSDDYKTIMSERKLQNTFIIGLESYVKEHFSSNDEKLEVVQGLSLKPEKIHYLNFQENPACKKYSKEIADLYGKMFQIENKSLDDLMEDENDQFLENYLLSDMEEIVSEGITFDDLKAEFKDWFVSISLLEELEKKKGVRLTMVFGDVVGTFSEENKNNMAKFVKTCLSEYKDWNISSPEGILCIIRYETPFKKVGALSNEKLIAGAVLKENAIFRINENDLVISQENNEKEVKFLSLEKLLKHLKIQIKGAFNNNG
jgi:hypothetical protein